jgi:hypothetical protein
LCSRRIVVSEIIRFCETPEETSECLQLVQRAYMEIMILPPGLHGWTPIEHRTAWHQIPSTKVVRAEREDGSLLATVTLVFDDPGIGLPCMLLFADQIRELQGSQKMTLSELTCVAADQKVSIRKRLGTTVRMLQWGRDWLLEQCDVVIGCCHPHHADFWTNYMGFIIPHPEDIRHAEHAEGAEAVWGYMKR